MIYLNNLFKKTLLASLLFFVSTLSAQEIFKVTESSNFEVAGTSSLHDWEMVSSSADGKGTFIINNGKVENIKSLEVKLKSKTLKSGKSGMDENAYKALKVEENPYIKFELERVISINDDVIRVKGDFTAGGTTKTEIFEIKTKIIDGKFKISGSFDITFKEYNMDPPTALMGTVKTGNELSISFNTIFINS
ncbi:MAG: YceI family protein [Brumimicrobium sp.]